MSSFAESRVLAYSREQLFDLVADVARYPEFLPWWVAARVSRHEGDMYETDQVIGIGPIRQRFSSRTVLDRPRHIEVTATGAPFRLFVLSWEFEDAPPGGCRVGLRADLEFAARWMQWLFWAALSRELEGILDAFEARARLLYGPAGDPVHD